MKITFEFDDFSNREKELLLLKDKLALLRFKEMLKKRHKRKLEIIRRLKNGSTNTNTN